MKRYQIIREIGKGTTSQVYQAADDEGNIVALKVFSSSSRETDWSGKEETRLLKQLHHPNILPIIDYISSPKPTIVMEYIEGDSLEERLHKGMPLHSRDALSLLKTISEAMLYVHQKGIVHGDLSPKNILLRKGNPLHPIICDFGLAQKGTKEGDISALLKIFTIAGGTNPYPIKKVYPTLTSLIRDCKAGLSEIPYISPPKNKKRLFGFFGKS
jgi:serine/threonine protein kinase|tara:strand:- start:800 stop:1441 length:642 start_codon:yes stop_codon:yes gene_type:complete